MADYYLKTDNIMKNMFTVALKDELAAQSQMGKVRPATEAMLQKVRDYELSEKRLPITTGEQRELRNALNRLRDKYLAMGIPASLLPACSLPQVRAGLCR